MVLLVVLVCEMALRPQTELCTASGVIILTMPAYEVTNHEDYDGQKGKIEQQRALRDRRLEMRALTYQFENRGHGPRERADDLSATLTLGSAWLSDPEGQLTDEL